MHLLLFGFEKSKPAEKPLLTHEKSEINTYFLVMVARTLSFNVKTYTDAGMRM